MTIVKLYFCFMPLLVNFQDTGRKNVTIIGEAFNQKDGAWVLSTDGEKAYFLDGVDDWDEKITVKKVKVCGRLLVEELKDKPRKSPAPRVPPPPIPQQIEGNVKRTILNAKWKLVDS